MAIRILLDECVKRKSKNLFSKKHQKDLATKSVGPYSLGMSLLPFPADSAEFEEYTSVMNAMADESEASAPNPEPSGWSPDEESDELRAREEDDNYSSMYESEEGGEDSYLDSYWEDQSEYGMQGCCGDF